MDLEDNNPQSGVVLSRSWERTLILVFLLYKATHFWGVTGDCQFAAPTDFNSDTSAGKLESLWLNFVCLSDERGSLISDYF